MNFGYIEGVIQDLGAYITGQGKIPRIPYQEDSNWEAFLPRYEAQADKFESSGCTLWAAMNAIETLHKRLYDTEPNYDEWFNYPLIPIKNGGVNPQVTFENIRHAGMVNVGVTKTPNTMKEALDLNRITGTHRAKGQNWLINNDFRHEWVWDEQPKNYMEVLKDALQYSPLAVSVSAWKLVNGEYVSDQGSVNNHMCLLYKFDENGNPWIFDTYDHSKKKLSKTHNIRRAKRIWLQRKDPFGMKKHITVLQMVLNLLMNKKTLLQVCKDTLGKDASPKDLAPDSLGCAESVTTILKQVYPSTPIVTGTYSLWEYLKDSKNGWTEIKVPEPEAVIVSVSGTGNGTVRGHTGIFDEDLNIMSNDSKTGKWMVNYNLPAWINRYVTKGKLTTKIYKKV